MVKTFSLHTLGCRANQSDSEQLAEILVGAGFSQVPFGSPADCQIVNTCTVTREADRKSAQFVRRAERAGGTVVATGCGVAARGGLRGVGSAVLRRPLGPTRGYPDSSWGRGLPKRPQFGESFASKALSGSLEGPGRVRSVLHLCIVPLRPGASRSYPAQQLLEEVHRLQAAGLPGDCADGYPSFGMGKGDDGEGLTGLLRLFLDSTRGVRFRLGLVEPDLFLLGGPRPYARLSPQRLCPHLHLVIQHASDRILERMHRGYDLAHYDALVQEFLQRSPGLV